MTTRLYLIRHAEAEGNRYRIAHGHYNSTVTPRGYRQLAALRQRFRDVEIDAVYGSDLLRTKTTASAIYVPKGLPFRPLPLLREVNLGTWEERTWGELRRLDGQMLQDFNLRPHLWHVAGAEAFPAVRERMLRAVRQIIAENPGRTVAAATHGSALRILQGTLRGWSLEEIGQRGGHCDNTGVTLLEAAGPDDIRILYQDDTAHLSDDLSTLRRQAWHREKTAQAGEPGLWYTLSADGPDFREQTAMLEERAVGAIAMALEGDALRVTRYEIDSAHRRLGLGTQLLGQAVQYARHHGREKLVLACGADTAAFFAQFGFVPAGTRDGRQEMELDIRLVVRDIPEN